MAVSVGVWSRRDEPCVHMPAFQRRRCAPGSSVVLGPQCMGPAVVCLKILRELPPPPLWWLLAARLDAQAGAAHAACAGAQAAQQRVCCAVLLPVCGLSACVGAVSMTRNVINALGCLSCFRAGHRLRNTLCCSWRPLCLCLHMHDCHGRGGACLWHSLCLYCLRPVLMLRRTEVCLRRSMPPHCCPVLVHGQPALRDCDVTIRH